MTINLSVLADMEIKYILSLCDDIPEDIIDELSSYFEVGSSNDEGDINPPSLSGNAVAYLQTHIRSNQLSVMQYLLRVKSSKFSKNKKDAQIAEEIMIGEILSLLDLLQLDCTDTNNTYKVGCLLSVITQLDIIYSEINIDDIVQKLHKIKIAGYSKEIYLSLIAKGNQHILSALNAYELNDPGQFKWILDPNKMIQLCFGFNKHWLMEIVLNCVRCLEDGGETPSHSRSLGNKLWQLVLIYVINNCSPNVSIQTTIEKLEKVFLFLDSQNSENKMHFYINEVYREFNVLKFCVANSKRNLFFGKLRNRSALSVISQTCDLSHLDWFKVKQALILNNDLLSKLNIENVKQSKDFYQWDIMTYNAYCIMSTIIDTIFMVVEEKSELKNVHKLLNEAKIMISNLHPIKYRFEILQNIFSCLFLRHEYFSDTQTLSEQNIASQSEGSYFTFDNKSKHADNRGFMCPPPLVKEILLVIKDCLVEIQNQYSASSAAEKENYAISFNEDKLKKFEHFVSSAMWRWQLITNLKIDTDSKVLSISSLYDNIIEESSDEDDTCRVLPTKKKYRTKKRRSKSDIPGGQPAVEVDRSPTLTYPCEKTDFISMLLSPPSSMLALCLEAGDFTKANRILEIFDMSDSEASIEVSFTEQFLALADQIRSSAIFSYPMSGNMGDNIEMITGMSIVSAAVVSLVETFLSNRRVSFNHQLAELVHTFPQLQIYDHCNSSLITITDLVICTGIDRRITYGLVNVAEKKCQEMKVTPELDTKDYNYLIFLKNIINIIYEMNQNSNILKSMGMCEILRSDRVPIKFREFTQQKDSLEKIADLYNQFNINFDEHHDENLILDNYSRQFLTLTNLLGKNIFNLCEIDLGQKKRNDTAYLKSFHVYLKNISQLVYLNTGLTGDESNCKDVGTDILKLHLHDIIGDLIYGKNVSIDSIELICKKLGINLIHKLVLNCCPLISCKPEMYTTTDEDQTELSELISALDNDIYPAVSDEILEPNKSYHVPNKAVVTYVLVHNWVIANLVKKIHYDSTEYILQQSLDARTKYLDIYLQDERFDTLKRLFDNNKPVTALQTSYELKMILKYLKMLINNQDFEICLRVIDSLLENESLCTLKDHIMLRLASRYDNESNWKYFISIKNVELKAKNVMQCFKLWPFAGAMEVLQHICFNKDFLPYVSTVKTCQDWLTRLPIYEKITEYYPDSTWSAIYTMSEDNPEFVLQSLMDGEEFDLCLKWSDMHQISVNMKNLITSSLLRQWFSTAGEKPTAELKRLLSEVDPQHAVDLCNERISQIRDIQVLKVIVEFVAFNNFSSKKYENLRIGVETMAEMDENERIFFWDIFQKPLLIIEQYLMNAKLEKLGKLLNKIRPLLKNDHMGDNLYFNMSLINTLTISVNAVDALLRIYAEKSLDLKSPENVNMKELSASRPEDMIFQSIDSINFVGNNAKFFMPEDVPPREQWAPNNLSDRCMCCRRTIFSIVVRRHHCRRCGRLICYSCSRHRLQINGMYGDIKVRACDDCYNQTCGKSENSDQNDRSLGRAGTSTASSDSPSMEWSLTDDPKHNDEVRKEFIYEFSPNVTLCLTIMKMHSVNLDCPRFLLKKCEDLSKAVSSSDEGGIREILRMRRALLVWCVVLYSRLSPSSPTPFTDTALAHTEKLLAATDALALLASRGCYAMMDKADLIYTRCIRNLLEAEKWELALDLSTKYGVSRTGVMAAWGNACLKAGCFQQARQKFAICFKSSPAAISTVPDTLETPIDAAANKAVLRLRRSELNLSGSQQDLTRIRNSPALLDEIVSLLENNSYPLNPQIVKSAESIKISLHSNQGDNDCDKSKTFTEEKFGYLNYSDGFSALRKTKKKIDTKEPALNIMHALSSLNKIKQGDYSDFHTANQYAKKFKPITILKKQTASNDKFEFKMKLEPFFYNECLFYLTSYGSHAAVIEFYLKYGNMQEALKYCCEKSVDLEVFAENMIIHCLTTDKMNDLFKTMSDMDSTWSIWTDYLMHACRVLERRGKLEWLYTIQDGVGDHVRAAITCAGLYTRPTTAPHAANLYQRAHILAQAKGHLQNVPRKVSLQDSNLESSKSLHLKMDSASLEKHINTICSQLEIANILQECEESGRLTETIANSIIPSVSSSEESCENTCFLPTLFGTQFQKIKLAALIIVCSTTITAGFNVSRRIIGGHLLDASKLFNHIGRYLVNAERYEDIVELCDCIKRSGHPDSSTVSDGLIEVSVAAIVRKCDSHGQLFDELAEMLILKTENIATKHFQTYYHTDAIELTDSVMLHPCDKMDEAAISCYIECRILKTAYSLAVKNDRLHELKRIMREAERLGQTQIKNACVSRLSVKKPQF